MRQWIGYVLRKNREAAGLSYAQVAWHADEPIAASTLLHCEHGNHKWPTKLDTIIGAYAKALGVPELALWEEALSLWKRDPEGRAIEAAERARRRQDRLSRTR